jgi:hypothetical protein
MPLSHPTLKITVCVKRPLCSDTFFIQQSVSEKLGEFHRPLKIPVPDPGLPDGMFKTKFKPKILT